MPLLSTCRLCSFVARGWGAVIIAHGVQIHSRRKRSHGRNPNKLIIGHWYW